MPNQIRWVTAFVDVLPPAKEAAVAFWAAASGTTLSPWRGRDGQFATFVPADADAHLRVQVVRRGGGVHLDLHVDDPSALADRAQEVGATLTLVEPGLVVLRSPGGLPWCAVRWHGEHRALPPVDQVCVDAPPGAADAEIQFWSDLLGMPATRSAYRPEFTVVPMPDGMPIRRLLVQRLDGGSGPVRAHLDLAVGPTRENRDAAVRRHLALGSVVDSEEELWTVMVAPSGERYCLTDRDPATGHI
jgi:hypothetical protein